MPHIVRAKTDAIITLRLIPIRSRLMQDLVRFRALRWGDRIFASVVVVDALTWDAEVRAVDASIVSRTECAFALNREDGVVVVDVEGLTGLRAVAFEAFAALEAGVFVVATSDGGGHD